MWPIFSIFHNFLKLCSTVFIISFAFYKWRYQYWKKRNLPYLQPEIPFGNFGSNFTQKSRPGEQLRHLYDEMKLRGWKHGGIYKLFTPIYLVVDLKYIKNIMAKDYEYFSDKGIYYDKKNDPLTAHLFNVSGTIWKNLRAKLTPSFTSGKMRLLFEHIPQCEKNLLKGVETQCQTKSPIDIKDILGCFTTDVIGSWAFGLELKTTGDEETPFRAYGRRLFAGSKFLLMKINLANTYPGLSRLLSIRILPKDISAFFIQLVEDTMTYRESNNVVRNDFLQMLIGLKNMDSGMAMDELTAQAFVFFTAGFETSSTTMTFTMYELAKHQDIQDKVRAEILSVLDKFDGKISYESIREMKYLDQVLDESLRKYPAVGFVQRKCVKDYKVPDCDVVIEKGTLVYIPILGIHHDEEYYPNPEEFDPERFSEENKQTRNSYSHIPFGEGPRICIGMRFGLIQSKVGIVSLLKNYKFTVNRKTQEPLQMKTYSLVLAVEGEVWLDAQKI